MCNEPVLIVGAGPVGMTAAAMLARFNVPVRIIDAGAGPTTQSRALVVWRRTLEVLDPIVSRQRFLDSRPLVNAVNFSNGKKQFAQLCLAQDGRAIPGGVFIPQSQTEALLLEGLTSVGVEVERGTSLTSLSSNPDRVEAILQTPAGEEAISTPWLVACDGGKSVVRHNLGLEFPGHTVPGNYVLADIMIDRADERLDVLHVNLAKRGTVVLFPIGQRLWRIFAFCDPLPEPRQSQSPTIAELQKIIDTQTTRQWTVESVPWCTPYHANERQIKQYVHDRILLAGDAAHVHSPAGGQGMNIGIQDAANLAWKLAITRQGNSSSALLHTYQAERHPIGQKVVRASSLILGAASKKSLLSRFFRRTVLSIATRLPLIRKKLASIFTEDVPTYRRGPLGGKKRLGATCGPGDFFPDIPMLVGGHIGSATDLCLGHGATLICFSSPESAPPDRFGSQGRGLPLDVMTVDPRDSRGGARLAKAFGVRQTGFVLVRPDGVIATICESITEVEHWMELHLASRNL